MYQRKRCFLIFSLLTMWGCLLHNPLFGQSPEMEQQIVEQLDIVIETEPEKFSQPSQPSQPTAQTITTRLKTRKGDIFSQSHFDKDLKMLIQDYDRIEPVIESREGKIYITLHLWANPHIRSITWKGNKKVKTSQLLSELGMEEGTVFDRQKFSSQAFHAVKTYYVKNGFFEAELDYQINFDDAANEVDIIISINEGRGGKIQEIIFSGFNRSEENELLAMMVTKEYNFFLSWLTGEGIYNEEMIQHDKFIILNYLQNKGYADAVVEVDICEAEGEEDRLILHINATRYSLYSLGKISVTGNTTFSDEEILRCINLRAGGPYSPEKIHDSMRIITNFYGRSGYIEAVINYEPRLVDESTYAITITVDEGEVYYIGLIKVLGNCTTQTKVILRETLLIPGEVFNLVKLQLTERRLQNIGFFKNVNVYAVKAEGGSLLPGNYRDVHIEVEEANTGNIGASMGFSTVENIIGGLNFSERNFNWKGLGRLWSDGYQAVRGGGEYLQASITFGAKSRSYLLSWTKPYFFDTPWSFGFDLERSINGYISDDYRILSNRFLLHSTYDCNAFLRVGTHYRLQYTDVHVSGHASEKLQQEARSAGLISALGISWMYDSTDHPIQPTQGFKSRIEGEVAGFAGKHAFFSTAYCNSYFCDLWGCAIMKIRGDLRFLQPLGQTTADDLPLDERFFLGGNNTVRGYHSYRLGPKFGTTDNDDDPKGGLSMQFFSLEFRKPIFSRFELFTFFDAGSLSSQNWKFGKYDAAAGYGLRVEVFENAPPLELGMGYPLNNNPSDVKRFFITIGGKF